MTTKLIELQVDIPDGLTNPPSNADIVDSISERLELHWGFDGVKFPPITEIRVIKTMPSFIKPAEPLDKIEEHVN